MTKISDAITRAVSKHGAQVGALFAAALFSMYGARHAEARLLVTDFGSHSVTLYNGGTGALIDVMIPQGTGGLQNPNNMAFGPDGNLYVTDMTNVLRFNGQTGAFLDIFVPAHSGGLDTPAGLAFGPDGNLYVASRTTHNVLRFDGHTGAFIDAFVPAHSGGLSYPFGLTFGPDQNLYVVDSLFNSVLRYSGQSGAFIDTFVSTSANGGLSGALDLTFGPDGNLYVGSYNSNSVLRYNGQSGVFIDAFVPAQSGGLLQPEGVTFAPDGNLYVASRGTHSILRYDGHTGAFIGTFVAPGANPTTPRFLLFTLDAPSGLVANNISPTQIDLSWQDNSDSETAFAIWRRKGAAGSWQRVGVVPPDTTTFSDTGLIPSTDYTYRVRAISNVIPSNWSNEITKTTMQSPPGTPTSLVASAVSTTQITLGWFDNSDNETAFAVWRKSGAGDFQRVGVVPPNVTTFTDFGLSPGTTYTYRVRATNDSFASGWTNEATSTTLTVPAPAAPSGLAGSDVSFDHVTLTWTDNSNNETAFAIWRKSGAGDFQRVGVVPANSTSFTDTTVGAGTSYTYRVRATNDFFASPWTSDTNITTKPSPPGAPTGLTATAVGYWQINLTWTDNSSNETAFEVYRKVGSGSYSLLAVLPPNTVSYTDFNVSGATTYHYMVRAANDFWASALTNEGTATTVQSPPAAPTGLTAGTVTSSEVNLSWTVNSTNETALEIYRKTGSGSYSLVAVLAPKTASFKDTSISPSTSYSYRVRAANDFWASDLTNEITVTSGP